MHRRAFTAVIVGLMLFGLSSCSASTRTPYSGVSPTPPTSAPVSTVVSSTFTTARLHVVVCPTSYGVAPTPALPQLPPSMAVVIPKAQTNDLAVYTDTMDGMKLLGPAQWDCSAQYSFDGSGGIVIYPPGENPSQASGGGPGGNMTPNSPVEAISGSATGGCVGCAPSQACGLFMSAAVAQQANTSGPCQTNRPLLELVSPIASGIVAFQDPPGVTGDGSPSGGEYPANGVMTYHPNRMPGSWTETCTLPESDKALCTTVLNIFIKWYGQK